MKLVPWYPKGMLVEPGLVAVWIKPGEVTEREWLESLADRVQTMAEKAGPRSSRHASKVLGMPGGDPEDAGQNLVLGNLNLRTFFNCSVIDESPFPAIAEFDEAAEIAMQEVDNLLDWVECAAAFVSGHDLL